MLAISLLVSGKTNGNLHMFVNAEGATVFIAPMKMKSAVKGVEDLKYDWTLTTLSDSVLFTFTYICKAPNDLDSLRISDNTFYVSSQLERIYAEPKGGKWCMRLRAAMPFADFEKIAALHLPPKFIVDQITFIPDDKKWKRAKETYSLAIDIINNNKN